MPKTSGHSWRFKARFRRHAFGWKSQPAIARLREAVSEIRQVARIEPLLAAEGAVALLERISPALENVDSSSGAIGTAVTHTIAELVPVIVAAPADASTEVGPSTRGSGEFAFVKREILLTTHPLSVTLASIAFPINYEAKRTLNLLRKTGTPSHLF